MKNTGIVRKVDELGRVVIPKELRNSHGMPEGTPLEIYTEGDTVIFKKYAPGCKACGYMKNLATVDGVTLCIHCVKRLVEKHDLHSKR